MANSGPLTPGPNPIGPKQWRSDVHVQSYNPVSALCTDRVSTLNMNLLSLLAPILSALLCAVNSLSLLAPILSAPLCLMCYYSPKTVKIRCWWTHCTNENQEQKFTVSPLDSTDGLSVTQNGWGAAESFELFSPDSLYCFYHLGIGSYWSTKELWIIISSNLLMCRILFLKC